MTKHLQAGDRGRVPALEKLFFKQIAHLEVLVFILFAGCLNSDLFAAKVGLRPMPVDRAEELSGGGHVANWEPGIGNYEEDMDRYGFVARNLDAVYRASEMFWTNKIFFEWYIDIFDNSVWVNTNPETNTLVERIRQDESRGKSVEHVIIAREGWLYADIEGLDGPIEGDPRILYQKDVDELRQVFREAHDRGILNHPDYKLIQMVVDPLVYFNDPVAREIIKTMDGVTYESHQFGDNWPLWEHKSNPRHIADGANWVLGQGLEFIFYYGPIRSIDCRQFGESQYPEAEIEKKWLEEFWAHGLPKNHPKMNYYLNLFPFWCGAKRKVGPEDDPDSKLGFTKWLIEEIKQADLLVGPDDFIFSPLVFDFTCYYNNNPDLQSNGLNEEWLRSHWRNNGIAEARRAHPDFSPPAYLAANPHIRDEFGENYLEAIRHYVIRPSRVFDPGVFNIDFYRNKHPDLLQEFGADNDALRNHWRHAGIEQGRQAHAEFSVQSYLERYADLQAAFGDNYHQALSHYFNNGIFEGRNGLPQTPESCLVSPLSCHIQVDGGEWRWISSSSVPSGGSVTFGPAPQTNGSWTWSGPGGFSSSAREVVINDFREDDAGAYVVTFTNDCGAITMRRFTLDLADGGDAPTISDIAGQTIAMGSNTGPLAFTVNDAETDPALLTLAAASSNTTLVPTANIALGGSGANRNVTVTPAAGQSGNTTITITVSDGQLTADTMFVLTVLPGPDPRVFDFDDATLQGWTTVSGSADQQVFAAKTGGPLFDGPPNDSPSPGPQAGTHLVGVNFGYPGPPNSRWDLAHQTMWIRSPEFTLNGSGNLTAYLTGGKQEWNSGVHLMGNESNVPANSINGNGFMGIALRQVESGNFVALRGLPENNAFGWTEVMIPAAELTPYANDGKSYTLDFIDARHGGWGIIALDSVTIPGSPVEPPPPADPYLDWAATKGLSGPAAAFDADPDGDGIANGLEFVLGGEPNPANANSNSLALLPTAQASGDDLVFTYQRNKQAAYLNPSVEFSADLTGPWTTAVHGTNATITETDAGAFETVTVTIPKNGAPTLFARLKVVEPAPSTDAGQP